MSDNKDQHMKGVPNRSFALDLSAERQPAIPFSLSPKEGKGVPGSHPIPPQWNPFPIEMIGRPISLWPKGIPLLVHPAKLGKAGGGLGKIGKQHGQGQNLQRKAASKWCPPSPHLPAGQPVPPSPEMSQNPHAIGLVAKEYSTPQQHAVQMSNRPVWGWGNANPPVANWEVEGECVANKAEGVAKGGGNPPQLSWQSQCGFGKHMTSTPHLVGACPPEPEYRVVKGEKARDHLKGMKVGG